MNSPKPCYDDIVNAATNNDLVALENMINNGFDRATLNDSGDPILSEIVFSLLDPPAPHRYTMIKFLLKEGFNPNYKDDEGSSPLTEAMLSMDTEMLRILLDGGALPNEVTGFTKSGTLYDWAEIDYVVTIWDINKFPEEPAENDLATTDNWLMWLDRIAIKDNRRRPDHLLLLREYGARGKSELK